METSHLVFLICNGRSKRKWAILLLKSWKKYGCGWSTEPESIWYGLWLYARIREVEKHWQVTFVRFFCCVGTLLLWLLLLVSVAQLLGTCFSTYSLTSRNFSSVRHSKSAMVKRKKTITSLGWQVRGKKFLWRIVLVDLLAPPGECFTTTQMHLGKELLQWLTLPINIANFFHLFISNHQNETCHQNWPVYSVSWFASSKAGSYGFHYWSNWVWNWIHHTLSDWPMMNSVSVGSMLACGLMIRITSSCSLRPIWLLMISVRSATSDSCSPTPNSFLLEDNASKTCMHVLSEVRTSAARASTVLPLDNALWSCKRPGLHLCLVWDPLQSETTMVHCTRTVAGLFVFLWQWKIQFLTRFCDCLPGLRNFSVSALAAGSWCCCWSFWEGYLSLCHWQPQPQGLQPCSQALSHSSPVHSNWTLSGKKTRAYFYLHFAKSSP